MSDAGVTHKDPPKIQVFAMFPTDLERSEWNWVHCLTFQLDTLNKLQPTRKPYKWIRYATGVVIGAEGHLSFNGDSPDDVMEYDDDLRPESADLYYHIGDIEKDRMFPVDPDAGQTCGISSIPSTRWRDFRNAIVERDKECVLTGFEADCCDAVHLVPHSKGDQYIENYTKRRSRDPNEEDVVREVDDVRNGVLLNLIALHHLGKEIAFLMTPNFAITTSDIDPTVADATERRCTAHLFDPDEPSCFGDRTLRSGSLVRLPDSLDSADKWPPNILLDAIYGRVVFNYFATHAIRDAIKMYQDTLYPEGIASVAAARDKRKREHNDTCEERAKKRGDKARDPNDDSIDYFDALMFLPYILIPPDQLKAAWRKKEEEKAKSARSHLESYVEGWAEEVANASASH